jgi:caffeoyl-CoA O-methyltransferase
VTNGGPPRPVTPLGILAARLEALTGRLTAAGGLDDDDAAELRHLSQLASGLEPYLRRCSTAESPALGAVAERTRAEDWSRHPGPGGAPLEQEMLSGHLEGQLLKVLVHATRARAVLEVGTFTGYAALAMAEALPAGGRVIACEIDPDVARLAQAGFDATPDGAKVDLRVGPALDTLQELCAAGQRFELVFVDADKAGYAGYLAAVLDGDLLAPHGLICVDNTLMQGQPWAGRRTANGEAITAFNRAVADEPRVEQVVVPLRDGVTLIRRVDR